MIPFPRDGLTIREAWMQASSFLPATQDPQEVAFALLRHLFGWDRTTLYLRWDEPFPPEKWPAWQRMLKRRLAGEPLQYITGEQSFFGMEFLVTPAVLIPRSETEILVERIAALCREHVGEQGVLADIGTGSGAIAIALAGLLPGWRIVATDISGEALQVARRNAARLIPDADKRMHWLAGDLYTPVREHVGAVDVLVSNPPYIPSGELDNLQPEVRDYEPRLALDGGAAGLDLYRRLFFQLRSLPFALRPQLIGLEVGQGQAAEVSRLIATSLPEYRMDIVRDYAGIERHVLALKK